MKTKKLFLIYRKKKLIFKTMRYIINLDRTERYYDILPDDGIV